jgi:hypothetical protein
VAIYSDCRKYVPIGSEPLAAMPDSIRYPESFEIDWIAVITGIMLIMVN